jgi:hypothetical protein
MLGFLSVLLWPALATSRDQGARAVCYNNLRRLGAASTLYASDNRDWMAYPNWGDEKPGFLYTPIRFNPPQPSTNSEANLAAYRSGLWFQYIQDPRSYLCPIDLESRYYRARSNKLSSYVMNGAVCGFGLSQQSYKITDVWNAGCFLLWNADEQNGNPPIGVFAYNDGSTYPDRNEGPGRVHSPMGNDLLTVGGNVKFVTAPEYDAERLNNGRSLTWWSPFSSSGH